MTTFCLYSNENDDGDDDDDDDATQFGCFKSTDGIWFT